MGQSLNLKLGLSPRATIVGEDVGAVLPAVHRAEDQTVVGGAEKKYHRR